MLTRRYLLNKNTSIFLRFFSSSSKFSEDSPPGLLKKARAKNEWKDCVRFDSQNYNWDYKEYDAYSSAFAYGLLEQGFKPGDKLLMWIDSESSAEIATAQMGALKSGVSLVTVDEKDDIHHVASALETSQAKGLLVSPHTKSSESLPRANQLLELAPELINARPGERVKFGQFPHLTNVIHTGHVTIRGTNKFKETMLYVKKSMTNLRIPGSESNSLAMECFKNGQRVASLTNHEFVESATNIWNKYLNGDNKLLPVFLTLSLQYPLGFASLLACIHGGRKAFIPSTYNLAKIAKSFNYQKSDIIICEDDLYNFAPPVHKYDEVKESTSNFKTALVGGSESAGRAEGTVFTNIAATHSNLREVKYSFDINIKNLYLQ